MKKVKKKQTRQTGQTGQTGQTRQHTKRPQLSLLSSPTFTAVDTASTVHERCEMIETNLRARVSDLEDRIEELHDKLSAQQAQSHERELEWVDRYTAVLNPVAARVMGMNRAMQPGTPLRTPKTRAMEVAEDDGGEDGRGGDGRGGAEVSPHPHPRPDLDPARSYRREPAKRAPLMTPDRAGFRPSGGGGVRIPVRVDLDAVPDAVGGGAGAARPVQPADPTASAADAALDASHVDASHVRHES